MPLTQPVTILLVDDQPRNIVALEAALADIDCRLMRASSGREALKYVLTHDFAAIVLDIHMPDMDGFETARLIRARERSHSTPIIFMTADDRAGPRVLEGYRLGAVDYMYKPFNAEILRAKADIFVELFRKTAALQRRSAELSAMADALEHSKEHFRALIENAADLTLIVEADGRLRYASPSVQRTLGYPREQTAGQPMQSFLHPDDVASLQADLASMVASGTSNPPTARRWRHVDGSYRVLKSTATNLLNTASVAGIVVHARDVTERLLAEDQLRVLNAELERTHAAAALRHQALHDGLTGLPNRVLLYERLEAAVRARGGGEDAHCALVLLDLDRFKEVNDTLGHQVGDSLLQQIGERLQAAVLPTDLVARLGGDEFAVLLPETDAARAEQVANDLARALETPFMLESQPIEVDASIGIAVAPGHGQAADVLLRRADVAMYQAKRSGVGVAMYSSAEDQHRPDRLALLGELRHAIDHDELLLYYQPKLDLHAGRLVGVEALVRWQHPQRGFLPPSEFMPLAELSGLILPLSLWVLEAALRQQQAWRAAGLDTQVAVNLSRRMLHDQQLPDTVAHLLSRCQVPAQALVLEITESSLMADPPRAGQNLNQLRAMGVRISIDDFGTGYSSLASLKSLPVDELKIDQSFVRAMATDASARAIVRAIIDLAEALKLRVVAEGVEDRATWDVLLSLGCDVAQGYLLSPPLAAPELAGWVAECGPAWLEVVSRPSPEDSRHARSRGPDAMDVTQRELSEKALQASEERFRTQYKGIPLPTYAWLQVGDDFVLDDYNDAAEAMVGDAIRGWLGILASVRYAAEPDILTDLQTCASQHRTIRREMRYRFPDTGLERDLAATYVFVPPHTVMIHTEDVTDARQVEQQREAMVQSQKLRALGQQATGIAHDLNQSLMLVASYSDLARQALEAEPPDLVELNELLTTTSQAALDGGVTVKRLLLLTRAVPERDNQPVELNILVGGGAADAADDTAQPRQPLRALWILLVDNQPRLTRAVVRMLEPAGHVVSVASSGEEALEKLAAQTFDVVVADMGMGGGMNGWELADAVKHRWPGVRFLLATGWGAAIDPAEARSRGVEAVLSKPYHPADLLRVLANPRA